MTIKLGAKSAKKISNAIPQEDNDDERKSLAHVVKELEEANELLGQAVRIVTNQSR